MRTSLLCMLLASIILHAGLWYISPWVWVAAMLILAAVLYWIVQIADKAFWKKNKQLKS